METIEYSVQASIANADGTFQPAHVIATSTVDQCSGGGASLSVAGIGDFDGDGMPDVAVELGTATLQLWGGHGDGTFPTDLGMTGNSFTGLPTSADLNNDKLTDLGAGVLSANTIGAVLNTTITFSLSAPSSLGPLAAGGSANASVNVVGQNGFSGAVSLTCSTADPSIQCSLAPTTVNPGASSELTVITTGNSATLLPSGKRLSSHPLFAVFLPIIGIFLSGLPLRHRCTSQRILAQIMLASVILTGIIFQVACGGAGTSTTASGGGGTLPGTYTITVTATSGAIQRSAKITLTVN